MVRIVLRRISVRLGRVPAARFLALWLVLRTALWTAVVAASHGNPPLDLVEWLSWGHAFSWGYPKHPPLPAWLAAAAARVSPGEVWGVYFLSYAVAAGTLAASYRLGREYLPPRSALFAALALDGSLYLSGDPAEFSNNVCLGCGWAWLTVSFHRAFVTGRWTWWLAVGLTAGGTALCKYTVGVLLLPMAAIAVGTSVGRRSLRTPGPYLAAAAAGMIFLPHLLWLRGHEWVTLAYAAERSMDAGWVKHVKNPALFAAGQGILLMPLSLVLGVWPTWWAFVPRPVSRPHSAGPAPWPADSGAVPYFLSAAVLGPFAVLLLLSLATGCQLRQIWGSPLGTFVGVWLLASTGRPPGLGAGKRWLAAVAGSLVFVLCRQLMDPYVLHAVGRTQFPGKELSAEVNRQWNATYRTPFPIAAGEGWLAGNVAVFSPQRPVLFSSGSMGYLVFDPKHSPWTSDADMNRDGGVVLWDADQLGADATHYFRGRFPQAVVRPVIELQGHTAAAVPPVRVGLAFVPPSGGQSEPERR